MRWNLYRARRTNAFLLNRPVGVTFCIASPRSAARPSAAPPRPARCRSELQGRHVGRDLSKTKGSSKNHPSSKNFSFLRISNLRRITSICDLRIRRTRHALFPDMPCMKGFTEANRHRYTSQQPGTKSGFRPAGKPVVNRLSTGRFVLPPIYIGFCLFVLAKRRSGQLSSMPLRARGSVVSWANRPVDVPSCPAPSRIAAPPCAAPPRPACGMSGFWIRQVIFFPCMWAFRFLRFLFVRTTTVLIIMITQYVIIFSASNM